MKICSHNASSRGDVEDYQVVVNNIGVKPSGSISKTALYKSADIFQEMYLKHTANFYYSIT